MKQESPPSSPSPLTIQDYYSTFVNRAHTLLNQQESIDYAAQIQQKLNTKNVFERDDNQKHSKLILSTQRSKLVKEMEIHINKCPFSECKDVYEEVMVWGMFAGTFKEDPLMLVGRQVYQQRKKTSCPYGKTLNEKMLETHRALKAEMEKYVRERVI